MPIRATCRKRMRFSTASTRRRWPKSANKRLWTAAVSRLNILLSLLGLSHVLLILRLAARGESASHAQGISGADGCAVERRQRSQDRRFLFPVAHRAREGREESRQVRPCLRPCLQGAGSDRSVPARATAGGMAEGADREIPQRRR